VYLDYWGIPNKNAAQNAPASFTPDASLKIGVDVHDELSFSAKACVSCHGVEIDHIALDYQPTAWFNVQFGRLAVPFGEYSQRVDSSGHKTASAPLIYDMGRMAYGDRTSMNLGVLPQPYVDTGVLVYGTVWLGSKLQVWYGLYGVAGLKGANDVDWMSMRSIPYTDNNREPAGGGRLALTLSQDEGFFGDVSVGASGSAGHYDKDAKLKYLIYGLDASARFGPVTIRGEYAARKMDLSQTASYPYQPVDFWMRKEGWYAELEHPLGKYLSAVYRYDTLRRLGVPLPGTNAALTPDSSIVRYTAGLVVSPAQAIYMKLMWEYWDPTDFQSFHSYHVGLGGAF
ncbi:MAG TPA: hypothetical protein VML50_16875, partial [Anaeromyxobacter sp.]|nr:hypothetical protein [Anaeromyxobacter sp.]